MLGCCFNYSGCCDDESLLRRIDEDVEWLSGGRSIDSACTIQGSQRDPNLNSSFVSIPSRFCVYWHKHTLKVLYTHMIIDKA